jgi:adenylate cyclase
MQAFLGHELIAATLRSDQSRNATTSTNAATVKLAIGFVDIVGYTPIADAMNPDDLGAFIIDFERKAADAVSDHGGRVVKLIGDEVMFIVVDVDAAFDIARALIAAFGDSEATPRAGVIYGEMVARGGDYYGRVVNLASRVSAQASAGEVLTDAATADAAVAHVFDPAGKRALKGFAEPVELRSLR